MFFAQNGRAIEPKGYCVQGLEKLKQEFINQGMKEMLLDALFELVLDMVFHPIITIASVIVVVLCLGWKWLLIILGVLYLLVLIGVTFGEWLIQRIAGLFDKKHVFETMEQSIERLSRAEVIAEYYSKNSMF